ncbi:hypothetical protein KBT16_01565 [Nostoc sp. CCCryo 231-06]|nr:hypothetical protein [Nostoc sp. CCCryo 231-06]
MRHGWLLAQMRGVARCRVLRMYGGTTGDWGRGDDSVAGGTVSGDSEWDEV